MTFYIYFKDDFQHCLKVKEWELTSDKNHLLITVFQVDFGTMKSKKIIKVVYISSFMHLWLCIKRIIKSKKTIKVVYISFLCTYDDILSSGRVSYLSLWPSTCVAYNLVQLYVIGCSLFRLCFFFLIDSELLLGSFLHGS